MDDYHPMDEVSYVSHVTLGATYEDVATGRIGTATAIQFVHSATPTVKLEWRDADQVRDLWVAAGRLRRYEDVSNGAAI